MHGRRALHLCCSELKRFIRLLSGSSLLLCSLSSSSLLSLLFRFCYNLCNLGCLFRTSLLVLDPCCSEIPCARNPETASLENNNFTRSIGGSLLARTLCACQLLPMGAGSVLVVYRSMSGGSWVFETASEGSLGYQRADPNGTGFSLPVIAVIELISLSSSIG